MPAPFQTRRAVLASLGGAASALALGAGGWWATKRAMGAARLAHGGRGSSANGRALGAADTPFGLLRDEPDVVRLAPDGRTLARANLPVFPPHISLVRGGARNGTPERVIASDTGEAALWSMDARDLGDVREVRLDFVPDLVSPSPDGRHVAVASIAEGIVAVLDAPTLREIGRARDLPGVHDLRFDPAGTRLYVSTLDRSRLVAFDAPTLRPIAERVLHDAPAGIDHVSRTPDGHLGLAVSPGEPRVWPIDLPALDVLADAVPLPSPPLRALVGATGDVAWLPAASEPELYRLDLDPIRKQSGESGALGAATLTELPLLAVPSASLGTVPLGGVPRSLEFEPFADTVLVATDRTLERVGPDGSVRERIVPASPVRLVLAVEGGVGTWLLHEDGSASHQSALAPLGPVSLPAPPLFALTSGSALAFCHS